MTRFPESFARVKHILMWPQYWAWRLTGVAASEVTSIACHTDMWDIGAGNLSSLMDAELGLAGLFPPFRRAFDVLGPLLRSHAARIGIEAAVPVLCGAHDSNASLVPYLVDLDGPRTVLSTGTWITAFALGVAPARLPEREGVMATIDVFGHVVPNYRFPGGRLYETFRLGEGSAGPATLGDLKRRGLRMVLPVGDGDPVVTNKAGAHHALTDFSPAELSVLASAALGEQTVRGLKWIGAEGETIVMGPFATNAAFLAVLREHLPGGVACETGHGGISKGAAALAGLGGK